MKIQINKEEARQPFYATQPNWFNNLTEAEKDAWLDGYIKLLLEENPEMFLVEKTDYNKPFCLFTPDEDGRNAANKRLDLEGRNDDIIICKK